MLHVRLLTVTTATTVTIATTVAATTVAAMTVAATTGGEVVTPVVDVGLTAPQFLMSGFPVASST